MISKQEESIEKVVQWLNAEAAKPTVTIFKSTLDELGLLEEMNILIDENKTFETEIKQWVSKHQIAKRTIVRLKGELQNKENVFIFFVNICSFFFLVKKINKL